MAGSTSSYTKKASSAAVKGTAVYHGGAAARRAWAGASAAAGTFAAKLATGVSAAMPGSPASVGGAGVAGSTARRPQRPSPAQALPAGSGAVEGMSATQAAAAARLAAKQAWGTGAEPPVWRPPTETLQMLPDVWEEHPKVAVTAEIHGPFAVYKDIKGIGYTLGHVASQYPMATGFATKADAVAASTEAAASSVDWSYSTKTELKANAKNFKAAAALGTKLKQAAQRSRQPKVESTAAPAWTPPGGEATYASLPAHEQAIHTAYKTGECFTTQTPLPAVALQSVAAYQDGKYDPMNDSLWQNTTPTPSIAKHIANIDRVMAAASTPFNMTVIRSQGAHHPLYALMAKLTVGDDYACPGYDSASINKNNTWGGGNVKVIYRVPKGTKAIFMNSLNKSATAASYHSSCPSEYECLFARDSRWKVVGKEVSSSGHIVATVELISQGNQTENSRMSTNNQDEQEGTPARTRKRQTTRRLRGRNRCRARNAAGLKRKRGIGTRSKSIQVARDQACRFRPTPRRPSRRTERPTRRMLVQSTRMAPIRLTIQRPKRRVMSIREEHACTVKMHLIGPRRLTASRTTPSGHAP